MTLGLPVPTRRGWGLLFPVLLLCLIGILTIQAISSSDQKVRLTDDTIKQTVYIIISIGLMAVAVYVGYQRLGRWSYLLFVLCIALLVFLLIGPESVIPSIVATSLIEYSPAL